MASGEQIPKTTPATSGGRQIDEQQPWLVPVPSRAELTVAFSQALDLAEGREQGHANRLCYVALNLAQAIRLSEDERRTVFYAALLHDAGAGLASAETCRLLDLAEERMFCVEPTKSPQQVALEIAPSNSASVVEALRAHQTQGADVAGELGLDQSVQDAIAAHHERWDGRGYPKALKGEAIPIASRLIAAADLIESLISAETNALAARRNLASALAEESGRSLEPALAERAAALVRGDAFWLGLHSDDLCPELAAWCPDPERSAADLATFATVFAKLADAKGEYTAGHGESTAEVAAWLAEQIGFDEAHREQVRIAALLHDIGLLGVPARVIAKPDILSLSEMEAMRRHPTHSQTVLEELPGMEEIARWVGAHHERPDGRGYPEMLDEEAIPIEARIIALADTYVALTSPRPYRKALSHEDAKQVLMGGAGTQLDTKLVQLLRTRWPETTSSRTARRSRRRR